MSEEVRQELRKIEKEQSFEELAVLRMLVMNCIRKERDLAEVRSSPCSFTSSIAPCMRVKDP